MALPTLDPLAAAKLRDMAPRGMACALCGGTEDSGVCERLLFVEPGSWVHLSCAYWSEGTHETAEATIAGVPGLLRRAKKVECDLCGLPGASVACSTHRCRRTYHFACASKAGAVMFSDKRIYCTEHKTTKQATRGAIWDPQTKVNRPLLIQPPKRYQERAATLYDVPYGQWIRAGALTVLRCGEAPSVVGAPPPGFVAHRTHWSNVRRGETCGYLLSVVAVETRAADVDDDDDADEDADAMGLADDAHDGAGAHGGAGVRDGAGAGSEVLALNPDKRCRRGRREVRVQFEIVSEHAPDAAPIIHTDAAEAVRQLYAQMYAAQPSMAARTALFPYGPGFFFGWLHKPVQARLHGDQDNADEATAALPLNPSGCARTEPFAGNWYMKLQQKPKGESRAAGANGDRKRGRHDESEAIEKVDKEPGMVQKVKGLNGLARTKFKVARSAIHGWGLFVKEPISKGEMLIEYQGFLIRSSLNDAIIRKYTRNKVFGATDGSYIFRIDEDFHVDATIAGNIARFMNHSCAPNALSRIVDIGSRIHDKRIIIFAARDLQVGEELQYDYQFALGGEKIECHCGAPNCWGRMN